MKRNQKIIMSICMLMCFILYSAFMTKAAEKEYEYDDSGRVTKVVYEDGSYETYQYDDNGNITQINYVDANGDGSGESSTTDEGGTSTEGVEASTEDSMLATDSNGTQQDQDGSTSGTNQGHISSITDDGATTGDKTPFGIIIAVMITMLIGIGLIIRKTIKEER